MQSGDSSHMPVRVFDGRDMKLRRMVKRAKKIGILSEV
jgi:hypothetical protein